MNELFIKYYENEPTLLNGNFYSALSDWTVITGNCYATNNKLYTDGLSAAQVKQDCIHKAGNYSINFTLCLKDGLSGGTGSVNFTIGNSDHTENFTNVNIYSVVVNCTTFTDGLQIYFSSDFSYAITNVSIKLLDGTWNQIELFDDYNIPLNYQIADVKDPTKRTTTFSNGEIELPGTTANNLIFKHLYQISIYGSFEMNKKLECYVTDGNKVYFEGFFEITKVNVNRNHNFTYNALLTGNLLDFWNYINNKYLTDLDFSEYDHIYDKDNIVKSFCLTGETITMIGTGGIGGNTIFTGTTTIGKGYTYGLIDKYHKYHKTIFDACRWQIDQISPCLFIKEMFDKIFLNAGYSYTSTFLNSEVFKRLVYPSTDAIINDEFSLSRYFQGYGQVNSSANTYVEILSENVDFTSIPPINYSHTQYSLQTNTQQLFDTSAGTNTSYNVGEITILKSGYYNFNVNCIYDLHFLFKTDVYMETQSNIIECGGMSWQIQGIITKIKADGQIEQLHSANRLESFDDFNMRVPITTAGDWGDSYFHPEFEMNYDDRIYLRAGDKIKMNIYLTLQYGWSDGYSTQFWPYRYDNNPGSGSDFHDLDVKMVAHGRDNGLFNFTADNQITEGMTMKLNSILHKDIKQSDFIIGIVKMFNLYIEQTGINSFKIEPCEDFFAGYSKVIDLSNMVDFESYSFERPQEYLDSNLLFTYDDDNNSWNQSYRDCTEKEYGEYEILKDKAFNNIEIKTIFASTPTGPLCEEKFSISHVGMFDRSDCPKIFQSNDDGTLKQDATFKPRILYWAGLTTPFPYTGETFYITPVDNNGQYWGYGYFTGKTPFISHFNNTGGTETFDLNYGNCMWYWANLNGTGPTSNNLYNLYYRNTYESSTNKDSRLVTFNAILTTKDMIDIHFYNPIRIDSILYRLISISNFIPNKKCQITLLKLDNVDNLGFSKYTRPTEIINISVNDVALTEINQSIEEVDGGDIGILVPHIPIVPISIIDGGNIGALSAVTDDAFRISPEWNDYYITDIDGGDISVPNDIQPISIYEIKNGPILSNKQKLYKSI